MSTDTPRDDAERLELPRKYGGLGFDIKYPDDLLLALEALAIRDAALREASERIEGLEAETANNAGLIAALKSSIAQLCEAIGVERGHDHWPEFMGRVRNRMDETRAEIERLRDALQDAIGHLEEMMKPSASVRISGAMSGYVSRISVGTAHAIASREVTQAYRDGFEAALAMLREPDEELIEQTATALMALPGDAVAEMLWRADCRKKAEVEGSNPFGSASFQTRGRIMGPDYPGSRAAASGRRDAARSEPARQVDGHHDYGSGSRSVLVGRSVTWPSAHQGLIPLKT